jgi:hypothetical protein
MKTRGDGFAGFCLDTPLRDVIFLSRLSRHCCAAGKNILSVQTILPMFRRQRQTVQPSFLSRCDISRIHMNHIKQQTHSCTGKVRILGEHHVSSHIARLQANATTYSRNCTTVPILATKDDTGATLQNTSSCATFSGAEWRKKRHKSTLRKAVLFFAHAYLTITTGSRGRLPGHSLARLT